MPPEWAASGARLVLPDLELCFGERVYKYGYSETEERMLGYGYDPPPLSIDVLSMPKFVGTKGEETVQVKKGAYALKSPPADDDAYPGIAFRFFLDFPDGALRNDVTLPAERVFFTTKCWLDDTTTDSDGDDDDGDNNGDGGSLRTALDRLRSAKDEYRRIGEEIEEWEEGEGSGSAGEGVFGMFRRATGFRSRVQMSEQRTVLGRRVEIMERALPPLSSVVDGENGEGYEDSVVRGTNGVIFMKEGYMTVKRFGGLLGGREEYHIVGKFSITKVLDSD